VAYAEGELTWLYVEPSRHKQGIGRQLLRHAVKASEGNMSAEVLVGNEPALALQPLAAALEVTCAPRHENHGETRPCVERRLAGLR
jgi:GNAT superfamily N-acetyltransferase